MPLILHPLYLAVITFIFNALPRLIIITKKPLSLVSAHSDHPPQVAQFHQCYNNTRELLLGKVSSSLNNLPPSDRSRQVP